MLRPAPGIKNTSPCSEQHMDPTLLFPGLLNRLNICYLNYVYKRFLQFHSFISVLQKNRNVRSGKYQDEGLLHAAISTRLS